LKKKETTSLAFLSSHILCRALQSDEEVLDQKPPVRVLILLKPIDFSDAAERPHSVQRRSSPTLQANQAALSALIPEFTRRQIRVQNNAFE
jgi:hypothetical protein